MTNLTFVVVFLYIKQRLGGEFKMPHPHKQKHVDSLAFMSEV